MIRLVLFIFAGLSLCSFPAHAQCPALNSLGLVGHWTLDETSGTTAADSAGVNDGTMQGGLDAATDSTAGQIGQALRFDETDEVIVVPHDNALSFGDGGMSVAAWINPVDTGATNQRLVDKRGTGASNYLGWQLKIRDNGTEWQISDSHVSGTSGEVILGNGANTWSYNEWHHIVMVYEPPDQLLFYVDGVFDESPAPVTVGDYDNALDLSIGAAIYSNGAPLGSPTQEFDGDIDDVRIYDRALSAAEIAALYATRSTADPPAGFMVYDTRHARMMYCNGTDWVHAGTGSYNPNAVAFDGTTDYLTSSNLSGASESQQWSGSFWFRTTVGTSTSIIDTEGGNDFSVRLNFLDNNERIAFEGLKEDQSNALQQAVDTSPGFTIDDDNWHHVMWSFDLSDATESRRHVYVDGVSATLFAPATWNSSDFIDFDENTSNYLKVGRNYNDTVEFGGDIADLWMDAGTYIDLSVESNRRKFISESGLPMYLGPDGSIPTGEAPEIFLSGATDDWHTNKGTGGGFTENGELTVAASQPGDSLIPDTSGADITSNLAGHWTFDQGSGAVATDSSGNGNDGDLTNMGAENWVDGLIGGALEFNGTDEWVEIPDSASLDITGSEITLSAWVYSHADGQPGDSGVIVKSTNDASQYQYQLNYNDSNKAGFRTRTTSGFVAVGSTGLPVENWHHFAGVYNGSAMKIFVNGQFVAEDTQSGTILSASPEPLLIGRRAIGDDRFFKGRIDEVRVYDRALTDEEIAALHQIAAPPGALQYNPKYNVMQYFNGVEWVAMGPYGLSADPVTADLIGHWKLDEESGGTAVDETGNYDGTLSGSQLWDSEGGVLGGALEFDGSGDVINMDALDSPNFPQDGTVSLWVKGVFDAQQGIFDNWNDSRNHVYLRAYSSNDGMQVAFQKSGSPYVWSRNIGDMPDNEWIHVVVIWDTTNDRGAVYVNGGEVGSGTISDAAWVPDNQWMMIGSNFEGYIDDVRLYDRTLTPGEIVQIYEHGLTGGTVISGTGTCSNPSGAEGQMVYNIDHNVMQYCNGERWIGIGK